MRYFFSSSESSQPLTDCQEITFVMHNRFWLLTKNLPTSPSILNRQNQAGWNASKIKLKMQACFILYFKFWEVTYAKSYKIQLPVLLSISLQLFRTSLNIIWKRSLSQFPFFNRFTQTQTPQWPKSVTLLYLIVGGGGVNKMHQGENYQWCWGIFSKSLQFHWVIGAGC